MDDGFVWSKDEYSPLDIIDQIPNKEGLIVKVIAGFSGNNARECLSTGEIWRIEACKTQYRAIAQGRCGRYFSIPLTHREQFSVVSDDGGYRRKGGSSLKELLAKHHVPVNVVILPRAGEFHHFNITDVYKERCLIANRINKEVLDRHITVIPAYLKASLVTARPTKGHNRYDEMAKGYDVSRVRLDTGILMYSGRSIEDQKGRARADVKMGQQAADMDNIYEALEPADTTQHLYKTLEEHKPSLSSKDQVGSIHGTPRYITEADQREIKERAKKMSESKSSPPGLPPRNPSVHNTSSERLRATEPHDVLPRPHQQRPGGHQSRAGRATPRADYPRDQDNHQREQNDRSRLQIRDVRDIPPDLANLNQQQVNQCLSLLNMGKYARRFEENQINGSALVALDEVILVDDLGMARLDAKRLTMFCRGWRPDKSSEQMPVSYRFTKV